MGYYTKFELEVANGDDHKTDYEQEIRELSDYEYLFDDVVKWYNFEEDIRAYSKNHPNTVFELSGEGEESGDLWKAYFQNGKMQMCRAKIIYDEFDESKLF